MPSPRMRRMGMQTRACIGYICLLVAVAGQGGDVSGRQNWLTAESPQTAAPTPESRGPSMWLERMSDAEALQEGRAWLARATKSRDAREATWADMLLTKAVSVRAKARGKQQGDTSVLAAAYFYLGTAKRLLGRNQEALQMLQLCAALRPNDRAVLVQLAAVSEDEQRWDAAEDALRRLIAVQASPAAKGSAAASLGWLLFRAGRSAQALETFRNASQLAPADPQVPRHSAEPSACAVLFLSVLGEGVSGAA